MFSLKSCVSIFLCGVILEELCSISTYGQYPYPGAFYPPPPFSSSPPAYPFPFFPPPYYGPTCYSGPPPPSAPAPPQRPFNNINSKPRVVKPFRIQPGSGPVIVPGRGEGGTTPIIISTRTSRTPQQQPTLLSPFTNLIHTFLKSLAPRTCDCEGGEYR